MLVAMVVVVAVVATLGVRVERNMVAIPRFSPIFSGPRR